MLILPTNVVGVQAFAIPGSEPWRGDRDAVVLENVATCVTPSGFSLPVGTYHLGLARLAPKAVACHASSVPTRAFRGMLGRMLFEHLASRFWAEELWKDKKTDEPQRGVGNA